MTADIYDFKTGKLIQKGSAPQASSRSIAPAGGLPDEDLYDLNAVLAELSNEGYAPQHSIVLVPHENGGYCHIVMNVDSNPHTLDTLVRDAMEPVDNR